MADKAEETPAPSVEATTAPVVEDTAPTTTEEDKPATEEVKKDEAAPQPAAEEKMDATTTEDKPKEDTDKPVEKKDEGPKLLDLAFAMDCTGSMGSYIHQAQQNIRMIVEEIVAKESADIHLALVEYRDHPPQDSSFVTRVHDFTSSVREMKKWLDGCSASGGGDAPEAVADALHQVLKLNWREDATKICVFISDAPPHGLGVSGDHFANGCPAGLDCMEITNQLGQKGVTLYLVGCEPSINRYKEFFTALAHVTGGQYVPLKQAKLLSKVIVGGAQEEMSLKEMLEEISKEVMEEATTTGILDEDALATRIHSRYTEVGKKTKQLQMNKSALPKASKRAEQLSYCTNMEEVRKEYVTELVTKPEPMADVRPFSKTVGPISMERSKRKSKRKSFTKGDKDEEEEDDDEEYMDAAAAPPLPEGRPKSAVDDENPYEVKDDVDIDYSQVTRMVHKATVRHNLTDIVVRKK